MRDISAKTNTLRSATARAEVRMAPATLQRVRQGTVPKGDALEVARVAAIQAAKDTSRIIPFCHPLPLDFVGVEFELGEASIAITATVKALYKTGVEMEALTAASIAALTLYDMLKMLDNELEITGIQLVKKTGGKSDFAAQPAASARAAVLVLSDRVAAGQQADRSGKLLAERLEQQGVQVEDYCVLRDDVDAIAAKLGEYCAAQRLDFVFTCGGTGLGPRDCAPEALRRVIQREAPGIAEALRAYSQQRLPFAMLSRAIAGLHGRTLLVNLPGSPGAVEDALSALFPALLHHLAMRDGGGHGDTYGGARRDGGA